jgi:hypothetical protein
MNTKSIQWKRMNGFMKAQKGVVIWMHALFYAAKWLFCRHLGVDATYGGSFLWWNMFFPWIPFIQMLVVINISLDLLIGTWISIKNFIMKRTVWLFIDKKFIFLIVMNFWSQKIWISCLITTSQNGKNYIDSHSKFVIGTQYIMWWKMINSYEEFCFWKF